MMVVIEIIVNLRFKLYVICNGREIKGVGEFCIATVDIICDFVNASTRKLSIYSF